MRRRPVGYTLVLGCIGAFVFGAYLQQPIVMVAGPVGVAVLVLGAAAVWADTAAAQRFFTSYADGLGLEYVGHWEVPCFTPLLGAGNRRWCERWMMGDIVKEPCLSGGLGYFFYERREQPGQVAGRGRVVEKGTSPFARSTSSPHYRSSRASSCANGGDCSNFTATGSPTRPRTMSSSRALRSLRGTSCAPPRSRTSFS